MRRPLPQPAKLLEELASKVIGQMDRRAVTGFDDALGEMTRYHRFLLEANATTTTDGKPFSYARVGGWFQAPHQEWMGEYRRLFERAADRISEEPHFIAVLGRTPVRLLPSSKEEWAPEIIETIVDLGAILGAQLEAWVTRKVVVENTESQLPSTRLTLAGSDKRAYEDVLVRISGAWEDTLRTIIFSYWREDESNSSNELVWSRLRESWRPLVRHLRNTAYLFVGAVWNEDEIGAERFRDVLVRWPYLLSLRAPMAFALGPRTTLLPRLLEMGWAEACATIEKGTANSQISRIRPIDIATQIFAGVHGDVLLLAACILVRWYMNRSQSTDIAPRLAFRLLQRELNDSDREPHVSNREATTFQSLFFGMIRLVLAGERFSEAPYSKLLDDTVAFLDGMSEQRQVPGRVFTPSTLHHRDELRLPLLAILLAYLPPSYDNRAVVEVDRIASLEDSLPAGDASLRDLQDEFISLAKILDVQKEEIVNAAKVMVADSAESGAIESLKGVFRAATSAIEQHRLKRLVARPVSPQKIARIRDAMEARISMPPADIPFFQSFQIVDTDLAQAAVEQFRIINIDKGRLTEPAMEQEWSNGTEILAEHASKTLSSRLLYSFLQRDREKIPLTGGADTEAFWERVTEGAKRVGSNAVFWVSGAETRRIERWLYHDRATHPTGVKIGQRDHPSAGGYYLATVNSIDVYGGFGKSEKSILFSARALRAVLYARLTPERHLLDVAFESGENPASGAITVKYCQTAIWDDSPILEFEVVPEVPSASVSPERS